MIYSIMVMKLIRRKHMKNAIEALGGEKVYKQIITISSAMKE